jgi:hypothetical protein
MLPSNAFVLRVAAIIFFTAFTAAQSISISKRSLHIDRGGVRVVDANLLVKANLRTIEYDLYFIVIFSDDILSLALPGR